MHEVNWNYIFPYGNPNDRETYYNTPLRLREAVCWQNDHRLETVKWLGGEDDYVIPACGQCEKVLAYRINRCVKCEKDFILDFQHTKFCSMYPTCWNCSAKLDEGCQFHLLPWHRRNYLPLGLTPKIFTKEELDDFDIDAPIPWKT